MVPVLIIPTLVLIFILCLCVRAYLWFLQPQVPWSRLSFGSQTTQNAKCTKDSDCAFSNYKCFQSECIKSQSESCNIDTGMWVKNPDDNTLKCVCKNNNLITQSVEGGDCLVPIACGTFGTLNALIPDPFYCQCDKDFQLDQKTGLCVHITEKDASFDHCPDDTISSDSDVAHYYFDKEYLKQFGKTKKCLQTPCKTNILNGKPIRHGQARMDERNKFLCLCDAAFGNYGVTLNVSHYLKSKPGAHNACANIYENEPTVARFNFSHFCYFYLTKGGAPLNPICFTTFRDLPQEGLVEQFKGKESITIRETWPHTHSQYVLTHEPAVIQDLKKWSRSEVDFPYARRLPWASKERVTHVGDTQVQIPNCSQLPSNDNLHRVHQKEDILNNILYKRFLCKYTGPDPLYWNNVIVNPRVVEIEDDEANFSNGYELYRSWDNWKIKPAPVNTLLPIQNQIKRLFPDGS